MNLRLWLASLVYKLYNRHLARFERDTFIHCQLLALRNRLLALAKFYDENYYPFYQTHLKKFENIKIIFKLFNQLFGGVWREWREQETKKAWDRYHRSKRPRSARRDDNPLDFAFIDCGFPD